MTPMKPAFAPPPKRRVLLEASSTSGSMACVLETPTALREQVGIATERAASANAARNEAFGNVESYTSCLKHGRLSTNLCEKCLGIYVSRSPQLPLENTIGGANEILCRFMKAGHSVITSHIAKDLLRFLWTVIKFLAHVASACFVCFFMMWFVQPNVSPAERRKRELDDLRRKKADDEWRAKRDRERAERQSEQDAWLKQRDDNYRNDRKAQDDWEAQRDATYRQKLAADAAWRSDRAEAQRKSDQHHTEKQREHEAWLNQRDDNDARAAADANDRETRALTEKLFQNHGSADLENDLLKLSDLNDEKAQLTADSEPDYTPIETVGDVAAELDDRLKNDRDEDFERSRALLNDAMRQGHLSEPDRANIQDGLDRAAREDNDARTAEEFLPR